MSGMASEEPKKRDPDERVSLYPLDPLTALRAALQVDPKSEPVEGQQGSRQAEADG